jgi:hypothetical protein
LLPDELEELAEERVVLLLDERDDEVDEESESLLSLSEDLEESDEGSSRACFDQ